MIDVKVIKERGQSALVEYIEYNKTKRVTVAARDVVDDQVSEEAIELGIPYGVEWSKFVALQATPDDLEKNLRQVGIWTAEDALQNADKLLNALMKTYQIDLGTMIRIAKEVR